MVRRLSLCAALLFVACASMSRGTGPVTPGGGAPDGGAPADGGADAADAGTGGAQAGAADGGGATRPGGSGGANGLAPVDRGAEADFGAARARFDRGDREGARVALEAFVSQHPAHGARPAAELMLARLALGRGDAAAAKSMLGPLSSPGSAPGGDEAVTTAASARYYLGLAELRLGNAARARDLLAPMLPRGAAATDTGSDDQAVELRGALADALAGSGDPAGAIEMLDAYFRIAREHERAWARGRATDVAARVQPEAAWRAYGAAPAGGLARAVLGSQAASHLRSHGDTAGAAFIDTETSSARHAVGFDVAAPRVGPGDPSRIGLAIPLSGKFQVVGEAALRAAMLAGGAPATGGGGAATAQLVVRDTATDPDRAARGVSELTRVEAVIGIVGAASAKTGAAASAQATQDGIPLMVLEDSAPGALSTAFQVVHSPEARATALASRALALGVRRFALLGPDSAGAKRLREAFRRAVTAGGGTVVSEATYVPGATSFAAAVATIKRGSPEAVFVPDTADRLQLVAPALAVADLFPRPWSKARGVRGAAGKAGGTAQPVLLLSTASELSPRLVQSAGRYVQGALLCPGFFAAESDARARGFVEAYRAAYGADPHATEAYAYDAVALLRAVIQRGARTRADVVKALGAGGPAVLQGLTGNVTFGPDHARIDVPLVYVVDGDDIDLVR